MTIQKLIDLASLNPSLTTLAEFAYRYDHLILDPLNTQLNNESQLSLKYDNQWFTLACLDGVFILTHLGHVVEPLNNAEEKVGARNRVAEYLQNYGEAIQAQVAMARYTTTGQMFQQDRTRIKSFIQQTDREEFSQVYVTCRLGKTTLVILSPFKLLNVTKSCHEDATYKARIDLYDANDQSEPPITPEFFTEYEWEGAELELASIVRDLDYLKGRKSELEEYLGVSS